MIVWFGYDRINTINKRSVLWGEIYKKTSVVLYSTTWPGNCHCLYVYSIYFMIGFTVELIFASSKPSALPALMPSLIQLVPNKWLAVC